MSIIQVLILHCALRKLQTDMVTKLIIGLMEI